MNHLSYSNMKEVSVSFFLIGKLRDLLVDERIYLQALTDAIDKLAEMLTRMDDLIEYPHVRRDKRITNIIEMADLMIDSIELYVFRVENKHTFRALLLRSKLSLAIENLTTNIREFVNDQSGEGSSGSSLEPRRPYKVQDLSYFFEKDFIGRKDDIQKLVSYLVDHEEEEYRVVSIHGMGGLGKTTLARKVYKDKKVLGHFQRFAFVCVSQQCQAKEILKHILQQLLLKEEKDMKGMSEANVSELLQRVLGEKKCLIVADDVWSTEDWEKLNCELLGGSISKVLLTTRTKDVAERGFCYPLKCLSEDEGWELFRNRLFRFQDSEEMRMEELGREMIAWCRGNPLAVLVLRGVLVTKGSLWEWERFYNTRKKEGDSEYKKFKDGVRNDLIYSYIELPYPLKPCFLYMARFVEDAVIDVGRLYMLWDAEGMILSKDKKEGETTMDVGERYFEELVGRCMIEAELDNGVKSNVRRRYKFCRVHDLMREMCLSLVEKENFLKVHNYRDCNYTTLKLPAPSSVNDTLVPPRQFFYFSSQHHNLIIGDYNHSGTRYLRSLSFNGGYVKELSTLKKLTLVRVLSFHNMEFETTKELDSHHKLIHLRYLSVIDCTINSFPPFIFNYIFLQTLDMRADSVNILYNHALEKLKRLKHLFLPLLTVYEDNLGRLFSMNQHRFSRLSLNGLIKLETLVNLDSLRCEMKDVTQFTSLKKLGMRFHISSKDDVEEMKELLTKVNLDQLRHFFLDVELNNPKVEVYSDVLRGQMPKMYVDSLQRLKVLGLRPGKLLPEFSNYSGLIALIFEGFEIEVDTMPILEKLSSLKFLRLECGKLLKGKEIACSAAGFPQLTHLYVSSLKNWEKWSIEAGAMPNLHCAEIICCSKLGELPDGLKFTTSLEKLLIRGMSEEFKMRLIGDGSVGGEGPDFYKIRHVRILDID